MNQSRQRLTGVSPYCYLIPCFAVFGMFLFYPFFKTIYLSLFLTDKLGTEYRSEIHPHHPAGFGDHPPL